MPGVWAVRSERSCDTSVAQGSSTRKVHVMTEVSPNPPATQDDDTVWPEHDTDNRPERDSEERTGADDVDQVIERDTAVLGTPD